MCFNACMAKNTQQITVGTDIAVLHPDGGYADTGNVYAVAGEWILYSSENDGGDHEVHVSRVVVVSS